MQHGHIIQFDKGVAKVLQLRDLQNSEAWKQALHNKCKDDRYYEIVEETLECGFEHYYLELKDDSGNVRSIQPVFFVRQNLVEGVPVKIRSIVDGIRKTFPRFLTMRVLMIGCAANHQHAHREKTRKSLTDAIHNGADFYRYAFDEILPHKEYRLNRADIAGVIFELQIVMLEAALERFLDDLVVAIIFAFIVKRLFPCFGILQVA